MQHNKDLDTFILPRVRTKCVQARREISPAAPSPRKSSPASVAPPLKRRRQMSTFASQLRPYFTARHGGPYLVRFIERLWQESPAEDAHMHEPGQRIQGGHSSCYWNLDDASRQLTARTIADCLRHAGFPSDIQTSDVEDLLECDSKDDATEKKDLLEQRS